MKCIITGGAGFVGRRLAKEILRRGELVSRSGVVKEVTDVLVTDVAPISEDLPQELLEGDDRLKYVPEDIRSLDVLDHALDTLLAENDPDVSVFHLSSIMSGQGEEDFDLCLGVNVDGLRRLVDLFRFRGVIPKFVNASSIAAMPGLPVANDLTKLCNATTYGMTKAFGEAFVNDCSRKGFIDGRTARLPTIIPRPGAPNKAATGAFSSIIREPLHGRDYCCPLSLDTAQPLSGYRTLIDELIALHDVSEADILDTSQSADGNQYALAGDRCVQLHATTASLRDLQQALQSVAEKKGLPLATVTNEVETDLNDLVVSMAPRTIDTTRAELLGLPTNPSFETIIEEYIEDYLN